MSNTMHETYRETIYFGSLNGLRFLCILAVLWHHSPAWSHMTHAPGVLRSGFLGVDFFFVLSGFLITTLLLREEGRNGFFSLRGFYWRRFLRIVPVYFLVVTALGFYYIVIKGEARYLDLLPFYYLFLSNFLVGDIPMMAPTWSLSVEEQYYLVWPILLLLVPRRFILHVLAGLVALNLVSATGGLRILGISPIEVGPLNIKMFTSTYAPMLIGSGLAIILHGRSGFEMLRAVLGSRFAAPVVFFGLFFLVNFRPDDVTGWPNLLIHLAMAACLASIVIREDHALRPVFTLRPIARIGEISYGIYLYHLIGLHFAKAIFAKMNWEGGFSTFVIYSVVAIGMAEMSFRFYETPFLNLRHRKAE